jgi:hypothetical protein
MMPSPKSVVVIVPGATVASNATASGSIDTLGYNYCVISCLAGTSATASHTLSTLTLSHNTSAATGGTNLAVGDTDFTIPTSNVTTPIAQLRVDLRGKKRYLVLQMTPDTSAYVSAVAHLFKGDTSPVSATNAGVGVLHEVG